MSVRLTIGETRLPFLLKPDFNVFERPTIRVDDISLD
jgi:hypothetical protein